MDLGFLAGPLVGSVIGYFTNYIAVRMLFRPRKEIKVFGVRLPFTPGVIPKGKPRLAKAVGEVVANNLLTKEDITRMLLSESAEEKAAGKAMEILSGEIRTQLTGLAKSEDNYERKKEKLIALLCEQIEEAIRELPVGETIVAEGSKAIREKVQGGFLSMLISDDLIASLMTPMGERIQKYLEENGAGYVKPVLKEKIAGLASSTPLELLQKMDMEEEAVRNAVVSLYRSVIETEAEKVLRQFDIAGIIEEKINAMAVEELEGLVLSVMKKELDSIVRLGAVIGFVIGMVNIFIS